ncbi:hypothetical protein, variant 3 [Cryptococcus amylolentus CBS 6039]|uniref:Major facilitator superfamily (MFS) profile domain-containing protein n=1 Tax=Cryptococcus amylolentus CBS 6039 TaxID=1295533 RepID=A0A1E3HER5_9TREE|nr:hypothetical protein, variant 3 [Cryptococcus amylolentus CBS 6039]ODN74833.1 hypothetical protein, variant 3 [Cryptococcus amylolentus CBS 6039]
MAESIELGTIPTNASQTDADPRPESSTRDQQDIDEEPAHATSLSPVDGGWRAWLFLVAATWIEVLVWGLPFSVGILHVYWTNTLFPGEGASTLTLAATLQTGLLFVNAGLFGPVIAAYPRWQKLAQAIGLLSASVGLISSAFATRPWHLLVSIGCIYPLCGALYVPCATLLFEWFLERRGLATGIMYAGTGLGGTIVPYIMDGLLKGVGYKAAMCSLGIAYAVLGGVALIFIDRRIPISRYANNSEEPRSSMRQRLNLSFVKRPSFFLGITTILLTSVSSFATTLWLPGMCPVHSSQVAAHESHHDSFRRRPLPHQPLRHSPNLHPERRLHPRHRPPRLPLRPSSHWHSHLNIVHRKRPCMCILVGLWDEWGRDFDRFCRLVWAVGTEFCRTLDGDDCGHRQG